MTDPNQDPVDPYTALHFLWGAVMQRMGVGLPVAVLASLAWEWVIEPHYKRVHPEIFPAPSQDGPWNRAFDTVAVIAGWHAGGGRKCALRY